MATASHRIELSTLLRRIPGNDSEPDQGFSIDRVQFRSPLAVAIEQRDRIFGGTLSFYPTFLLSLTLLSQT